MKGWAIKWPSGWVDHRTVANTRMDAWGYWEDLEPQIKQATAWGNDLRRNRRKGLIRAVKVELLEIASPTSKEPE